MRTRLSRVSLDAVGRAVMPIAVALAAQLLLRIGWSTAPFAPYSIGNWVVRRTPGPLATEAIERLGHRAADILALSMVLALFAIGILLRNRPPWLLAAVLAAMTLLAAWLDPIPRGAGVVLASAGAAAAGVFAATLLFASRDRSESLPSASRRRLVTGSVATVALVSMGGASLLKRDRFETEPVDVAATNVREPDAAFMEVPGLSPRITPRDDHYVVDINLDKPEVDSGRWALRIHGRVTNPREITFDEILAMEGVEQPIQLLCISNSVGGDLTGNALWTTFPLADLLEPAGIEPAARAVRVRAVDGYEDVLQLDAVPGVLVAYAMGGETLPRQHGHPVRLIIPGHYGMRSVKWVTELEIIDEQAEGYWSKRGWDAIAPMRTGVRIDTPRRMGPVPAEFTVAGIAWAGLRGVSAVEVSTDMGVTWAKARLEDPIGEYAWRRWRVDLSLPPGKYQLSARGTDGEGNVQPEAYEEPHPAGVAGYDWVGLTVEG